jgi:hypothetical protein
MFGAVRVSQSESNQWGDFPGKRNRLSQAEKASNRPHLITVLYATFQDGDICDGKNGQSSSSALPLCGRAALLRRPN